MFSNQYGYYLIHGSDFSQGIDYEKIVEIILKQNCFLQIDNQIFKNNDNFPWINIGIVYTMDGNYSTNNKKLDKINLITITTSKKYDQTIYITELIKVAEKIGWKLYSEEDEFGNENIEINNYP